MAERSRVIVALPNEVERVQVADWLASEQMDPVPLASARDAAEAMRARPFDLLIADLGFAFREGLHGSSSARYPLTPTIVVGSEADEPDAMDAMTIYLARPIDRAILNCFATMALLEGRPTRRSARKPVTRCDAFTNGVPARLIDVSKEGLRIEVPQDLRSGLPASFTVRVPLIGVTVTVKRMWSQPSPTRAGMTWYGGALVENRSAAEQAWQSFVETIPGGQP